MVKLRHSMSDTQEQPPSIDDKWHWGIKLGIWGTAIWLAVCAIYGLIDWNEFDLMKPQDWGTAAAGAFAPLAFLWLVVATFLQMEELKMQRKEVRASRIAAQEQASATEALVTQNMAAVEVSRASFGEQQKRWKEEQLDKLIDTVGDRVKASGYSVLISRGINNRVHPFYITHDKLEPDEWVRRTHMQLKGVMPFEHQDTAQYPDEARKTVSMLIGAIDAIESEIAASTVFGVGNPFPAVQSRIDLIDLYSFRDQLKLFLEWLNKA